MRLPPRRQHGRVAQGKMVLKIAACTWFLEQGGRETIVADPEDLLDAVRGSAETHIVEGEHQP